MVQSDGGPAFPMAAESAPFHVQEGMSLLDWFAGQALAGFLPARDEEGRTPASSMGDSDVAEWAYSLADAMLKAREDSHG